MSQGPCDAAGAAWAVVAGDTTAAPAMTMAIEATSGRAALRVGRLRVAGLSDGSTAYLLLLGLIAVRVSRSRRAAGWSGSAGGAVESEGGRRGVAGVPGALEAERRVSARGDGAVVAGVGGRHGRPGLGGCRVPRAGDLLVTREREGQCPAVDRAGPGVGDGHVRGEPAGPLGGRRIRGLTRAAHGGA